MRLVVEVYRASTNLWINLTQSFLEIGINEAGRYNPASSLFKSYLWEEDLLLTLTPAL